MPFCGCCNKVHPADSLSQTAILQICHCIERKKGKNLQPLLCAKLFSWFLWFFGISLSLSLRVYARKFVCRKKCTASKLSDTDIEISPRILLYGLCAVLKIQNSTEICKFKSATASVHRCASEWELFHAHYNTVSGVKEFLPHFVILAGAADRLESPAGARVMKFPRCTDELLPFHENHATRHEERPVLCCSGHDAEEVEGEWAFYNN